VATLRKVAEEIEADLKAHKIFIKDIYLHTDSPTDALCLNATELAREINAKYIIAYTNSGYTAKELTKPRTFTPIITFTPEERVKRELTLVWGLNKVIVQEISGTPAEKIKKIVSSLKKENLIRTNDDLVIICNAGRKEKFLSTYKV